MAAQLERIIRRSIFGAIILTCGCQWDHSAPPPVRRDQHAVRINRSRNGAGDTQYPPGRPQTLPRKLAFEMSGFAARQESEGAEDRIAVRQAAIIDGLGRALMEARKARGQTTADFTARIGPNLTVTHRSMWQGDEIHVVLLHRGEEFRFEVVNGELKTPPQDFRVIQEIFKQTNGEFSLLGVESSIQQNCCMARVGGYLPVAPQRQVAGGTDQRLPEAP